MGQSLTLEKTIGIEGTLLMLDDATPHVSVPVQAICGGKVIATALSDATGKYQLVGLKPGRYQVRCQISGGDVYYGEGGSTVADESRAVFLQVKPGVTRDSIDFRFAPFKKGTWKTYTYLDGLAGNNAWSIHRDLDGILWFGTDSGVSRYDGKRFINFTTEDGLAGNNIRAIHSDPDGILWFGSGGWRIADWRWDGSGVSRYDGKGFVNFTTEDGLAGNTISAIHNDPDGILWFGTDSGVSRYDGKRFTNFTTEDGLAGNTISAIHVEFDGTLWFGTDSGVSRYDGKRFINFTTENGLVGNTIRAIHSDPDGILWFGTNSGVSRYDGKGFVKLTIEDGLVGNTIRAIHSDPDGILWFGTNSGVSRYDGKGFVNLTTKDGLADNRILSIHGDPDGTIWFGSGRTALVSLGTIETDLLTSPPQTDWLITQSRSAIATRMA